jgi:dTDP-4-dehydrorhamnose reductase
VTKVAVFGPSGMLGRQVVKQLGEQAVPIYRRMADLTSKDSVARAIDGCEAAINCAGVIPVRNTSVLDMIYVNAVFPHVLTAVGKPTVLVSTDCVFSGRNQYRYKVTHIPDPRDYYGRSKSMGEVFASNACVVRTSFIGCDHGFMAWILAAGFAAKSLGATQRIDGWKNALWSGSTVQEVASHLINMIGETGLVHLATEATINKYDLARKIIDLYELDVHVIPSYQPTINRALEPTHKLRPLDICLTEYKCTGAELVTV